MRFILVCFYGVFLAVAACAEPIEWPVNEGGNGHFYENMTGGKFASMSWVEAEEYAESLEYNGMSGHLATMTTSAEYGWVNGIREAQQIGHYTYAGAWKNEDYDPPHEGDLGWRWITGEAWDPDVVYPECPEFYCGTLESRVGIVLGFSCGPNSHTWMCAWLPTGPNALPPANFSFVVEFDNFSVVDPLQEHPAGIERSTWGTLKSIYR